jgi:hypothetical protein
MARRTFIYSFRRRLFLRMDAIVRVVKEGAIIEDNRMGAIVLTRDGRNLKMPQ